jgi:hypothetical protein
MASSVLTPPPARTVSSSAPAASQAKPFISRYPSLALFLISAVGLFIELLLIRWVTTEIRIFAYLQNTVLVVCFLGLGMGCWDSRKRPFVLREMLIPLAILVGLLAVPTTRIALGEISRLLGGFSDLLIWGESAHSGAERILLPFSGLVLVLLLMILLWEIFVPVGRLLGRLMDESPNTIAAYSWNVTGSLIGIWLFVALSAVYLPAIAWFAVFALGCVFFIGTGGKSKAGDAALLATIVGFSVLAGYEPGWEETRWSPYQKLALKSFSDQEPEASMWASLYGERSPSGQVPGSTFVGVNNTGYQAMINLSTAHLAADPKRYDPEMRGYSQYDLPAKFHPSPKKVLVVGAGTGNDVAGMLRNGVSEVIAVEIDPVIVDYGRRHHPERPYDNPKVRIVTDDARSFFATTQEKFDVITFGLLDSHTTTAMTNARLDHYVYTEESLTHAKKLLNDGGVIVLSFEARKPYILNRMAGTLGRIWDHDPMVFRVPESAYGWGGVVFVCAEPGAIDARFAADPRLGEVVHKWQKDDPITIENTTAAATDDWPYIYLERPMIPVLYLLLAVVLGLLFARGVWKLDMGDTVRNWSGSNWHFFFLGAAFMLLEVQNISKAAVVLGNTWTVNAVIISGILMMILLANLLVAKLPRIPLLPVYMLLVGSCVGLYFLDLSKFAFLPYATKAVAVGLLTSLPMLFSGIVFIRSFAATERKDTALGANLMGSLVGGLLQTVTFLTGIKALLLIVAGLYLVAVLTRPRRAIETA